MYGEKPRIDGVTACYTTMVELNCFFPEWDVVRDLKNKTGIEQEKILKEFGEVYYLMKRE